MRWCQRVYQQFLENDCTYSVKCLSLTFTTTQTHTQATTSRSQSRAHHQEQMLLDLSRIAQCAKSFRTTTESAGVSSYTGLGEPTTFCKARNIDRQNSLFLALAPGRNEISAENSMGVAAADPKSGTKPASVRKNPMNVFPSALILGL